MPSGNVFHEADTFAFDGIGDDDGGLSASGLGFGILQRLDHLLHVVAVDGDHVPSEAAIFFLERLDIHHVFDPAIDLEAVAIDDTDEVVELEVARFHRGFPDLAFLLLAISHDAEDMVTLLVQPGGQREADGDAQTLAERACGDFHPGQLQPMRMALKGRIEFAEERDVFLRTESREGQSKIKAGRFVSGRPDNAIAIGPVGVFGIVCSDAKVERGGDIHDGERPAGVSGRGRAQGGEVVAAHQIGLLFQFFYVVRMQNFAIARILNRHGVTPSRTTGVERQSGPGRNRRIGLQHQPSWCGRSVQ